MPHINPSNLPDFGLDNIPERSVNSDAIRSININELPSKLFSLKEVKQILGQGDWSIYCLLSQNRLRSVKIGGRRLMSLRAINEYVASLEARSKENGNYGI